MKAYVSSFFVSNGGAGPFDCPNGSNAEPEDVKKHTVFCTNLILMILYFNFHCETVIVLYFTVLYIVSSNSYLTYFSIILDNCAKSLKKKRHFIFTEK